MIAKYNNLSLATGVPGLVLEVAGSVNHSPELTMAGVGLLLVGFAYYAKAKGRHTAWCLMAFLSIIGLIVLASLKDLSVDTSDVRGRNKCPCGNFLLDLDVIGPGMAKCPKCGSTVPYEEELV